MATTSPAPGPAPAPNLSPTPPSGASDVPATPGEPRIRVVYRSGAGDVNADWPVDRIAEAIADTQGTLWVDIEDRESNTARVEPLLRDVFGFHALAIEDALKECHVPRVDNWDRYLYMVFHSVSFDASDMELRLHELDLFLGQNYLVSYHSEPLPVTDQLRRNLERDQGQSLERGADHVLYLLLDLLVADYLPVIEHLDDAIDNAQDEVFGTPSTRTLHRIFQVKRAALRLHRTLIPEREVLNRLARDTYSQIDAQDRVYFRDVYDHTVRLHDISETLRDLISGALDTYLSAISNRTNEIMKTLTLVTVMFLPMTFLAGFFGMNYFGATLAFQSELPHTLLFWITCFVMFVTPFCMAYWARMRKWY
jgi:magnesium transporter